MKSKKWQWHEGKGVGALRLGMSLAEAKQIFDLSPCENLPQFEGNEEEGQLKFCLNESVDYTLYFTSKDDQSLEEIDCYDCLFIGKKNLLKQKKSDLLKRFGPIYDIEYMPDWSESTELIFYWQRGLCIEFSNEDVVCICVEQPRLDNQRVLEEEFMRRR